MAMLQADELLLSPIVANSTMNRGRGFAGVNSYERELHLSITGFLAERMQGRGSALWYDACCGEGRALVEAGRQFDAAGWGGQTQIVGVDLVGLFTPNDAPHVTLLASDVTAFVPQQPADLVTCVHGLHYLGDKLGFLQHAYSLLAPGGLLLGHLDASNVRAEDSKVSVWRQAARYAANRGVKLGLKSHLLRIQRTDAILDFGVAYQGATVSEKPNYTGITVIDSWYMVV